jgi:Ca2+-binding EF-hand superfamily protein
LQKSDLSVEEFFRFLDKDKSAGISIQELTKGTKDIFNEEEARIFFLAVDNDNSGEISFIEIISTCSRINC